MNPLRPASVRLAQSWLLPRKVEDAGRRGGGKDGGGGDGGSVGGGTQAAEGEATAGAAEVAASAVQQHQHSVAGKGGAPLEASCGPAVVGLRVRFLCASDFIFGQQKLEGAL